MVISAVALGLVALVVLGALLQAARTEYQDDAARSALVRTYILLALPLGPMYTGFFFFFDAPWAALAPALFFGAAGGAGILAKLGKGRAAATLLVYGIWICPIWAALCTGGSFSSLVIWMAPAPFMGGPLIGRGASVVLATGAVVMVMLMSVLPDLPPGLVEMTAEPGRTLLSALCGMTAIALLGMYGYSTTRTYYENALELEARNDALTETTACLEVAGDDMRRVLDNVAQGLLTLDAEGNVRGEWSAMVERWLGVPKAGTPFWTLLERQVPDTAAMFEMGFDDLEMDIMPAAVTLDQMPSRATVGSRQLAFALQAMDGGYLLVISDITDAVERQRVEAAQKQVLALVRRFQADRPGTRLFIREVDGLINRLPSGLPAQLKRDLHTVKGNAGIYGLKDLALRCHDLEDELATGGSVPDVQLRELASVWGALKADFETFAGPERPDEVAVPKSELEALRAHARTHAPYAKIERIIESLSWQPATVPLNRLAEQAERLALSLDKSELHVRVEGAGVRLDPNRFGPLWSVLIHAVRNAVDHGIEDVETRRSLGKPDGGQLTLELHGSHEEVVIEVADDGRGIDWRAVAESAQAHGLPFENRTDLEDALFSNGLSTKQDVTAISGRGIGTSALRDAVQRMGGRVEVESEASIGTRIRCIVPLRGQLGRQLSQAC